MQFIDEFHWYAFMSLFYTAVAVAAELLSLYIANSYNGMNIKVSMKSTKYEGTRYNTAFKIAFNLAHKYA
jgi:hypothetical protein